jgi:hypothetical protein
MPNGQARPQPLGGGFTISTAQRLSLDTRDIHVRRTWSSALKERAEPFTCPKSGERRVDMSLQLRRVLQESMVDFSLVSSWASAYDGGRNRTE